jgi:hypothetical protein
MVAPGVFLPPWKLVESSVSGSKPVHGEILFGAIAVTGELITQYLCDWKIVDVSNM